MSPVFALLAQVAIGTVPIGVAAFAYIQATKANRITAAATERIASRNAKLERSKVDAEAYNRAREIYEAALHQLERQLERIQEQFEVLSTQLAHEQDTSRTLRLQVDELRAQITVFEHTVGELRARLTTGAPPIYPPPIDEKGD